MLSRRFLPRDAADFLRSIVPFALLAGAAALPGARVLALGILVIGVGIAIGRAAPVRWVWAAAVPVAIGLTWQAWRGGVFDPGGLECTSLNSPFAMNRFAEAIVVIGVLGALATLLRGSREGLGLRLPARRYRSWAIVGFIIVGPIALVVGPFLAAPFFGPVTYDVWKVGAIGPALVFAVSNGVMEELAYRGALMSWSARAIGVGPALVAQALIFGFAHTGADVHGAPILLMAAMATGGLLAGVIALRTRSLLIPIALHVGLDIPIYYAWACATP